MRRLRFPTPLTSLIGREHDLNALQQLLQRDGIRLVTLVGPAGVGKTHLGLQAANAMQHTFADGRAFIPLASIRDPNLVLPTIAQHLNRPPNPEALITYLTDKQMLLLLDNFEQIITAGSLLAELLSTCLDLRILITSRESLRIRGEYEFPVQPLTQSSAVTLFAQRAQALQPDFALNSDNLTTVAEICKRVDGLPLAIELAASRIKLFPPSILLAQLDRRLQVLANGPRDLSERHQTLRSAIQWSYDLLTMGEQRLFRRLGVFAGGCTLAAASLIAPMEIERGVESLIDKNLLWQVTNTENEQRLLMLETIREFALEQLITSGEAASIQRAHAEYYRGLTEYAEPQLIGNGVSIWLDRLEREHDNLRAALTWAVDRGEAETAHRLSGALWRFWFLRGHLHEGRKWLETTLAMQGKVHSSVKVKVLSGAGYLAATQSDYARAQVLCETALELAQNLEDEQSLALALFGLANTANWGRNSARARSLFEASLEIYRKLKDTWGVASTLAYLGNVLYFEGEYEAARPLFDEALILFRNMGQVWGIAFTLYSSGLLAINQKELKSALRDLEQSQTYLRQLGDRRGLIRTTTGLAKIALEQKRLTIARGLMLEAMHFVREVGDNWSAAVILDLMGSFSVQQRQFELAAKLFGAAEALRVAINVPLSPAFRDWQGDDLRLTRATLSSRNFALFWTEGKIQTAETVTQLFEKISFQTRVSQTPLDDLTVREIDVLRLVGEGLPDADIADHLSISVRTVNAHLRSIYSKLNVTSRTAAARWGMENGLFANPQDTNLR
jgi:predicted ATPase/DNA-binding CsgD family transcriptional regulator